MHCGTGDGSLVPPDPAQLNPESASRGPHPPQAVPVHLAVPEKCCGLTPSLAFFDRCGKRALAFSATGNARTLFPRARGRLCDTPRTNVLGVFFGTERTEVTLAVPEG